MAKQVRNLIGLALLLVAMSAFGQDMRTVRANVPFSFESAGKSWPAGDYKVRFDTHLSAVIVSAWGMTPATVFTTRTDDPASATRTYLRFHRYGDTWVLREVSFDGTVQTLRVSKFERELLRADLNKPQETREIVSDSPTMEVSKLVKSKD